MDLDEGLLRPAEQRIALRCNIADFGTDRDHEIRSTQSSLERMIGHEAEMPRIAGMTVVHVVLAAEARRDRNVERLRESLDRALNGRAPSRPADDDERPMGCADERA